MAHIKHEGPLVYAFACNNSVDRKPVDWSLRFKWEHIVGLIKCDKVKWRQKNILIYIIFLAFSFPGLGSDGPAQFMEWISLGAANVPSVHYASSSKHFTVTNEIILHIETRSHEVGILVGQSMRLG